MTARETIELVKQNLGVPFNQATYRDTFKIGDPDTQVKGHCDHRDDHVRHDPPYPGGGPEPDHHA